LFLQAPADCKEKAKWRLLSSKTISGYLTDLPKNLRKEEEEESSSRESIRHDDRVPEYSVLKNSSSKVAIPDDSTPAEERGRELSMSDESSTGVGHSPTIDRKAGSSREKGWSSMFLTSLSGIEGPRGPSKKQPHRKRKVHEQYEGEGEALPILPLYLHLPMLERERERVRERGKEGGSCCNIGSPSLGRHTEKQTWSEGQKKVS
jgi:hypothetical protein